MRNRRSLGLSKSQKILGTGVVSVIFGVIVSHYSGDTGTATDLSFIRDTGLEPRRPLPPVVRSSCCASSNAVNLTDGLDGLASGSSILVFSAYVFIAFWQFRHPCAGSPGGAGRLLSGERPGDADAAIVAAGMMGAATGFLWWNAAPARIFMGDTGSLALGGLMGALAIVTNTAAPARRPRRPVRDRDDVGDRSR